MAWLICTCTVLNQTRPWHLATARVVLTVNGALGLAVVAEVRQLHMQLAKG